MTPDPEASLPLAESQVDTTSDAGVKATGSSQLPTLGERLVREARRLANSHVPTYPWLRLLDSATKRVNSLPVPSQARFQRTEATHTAEPSRPASREPVASAEIPWPGQPFPYPHARDQFLEEGAGEWGQPLSPYIQQRLRDFAGPGAGAIRVHTDEMADAIARAQRADAVTVGQQVFFRQGRFRPHEDEGFALLTHEAMHVIQAMRPGAAWRRATQVGVQEEEQEAGTQERDVLRARREVAFPPQPARHTAPAGRPSLLPERQATAAGFPIRSGRGSPISEPALASSPVHRPMAAPAERAMDNATPPTSPAPDVEGLKRMLYRDLMRQIRADLERGG